MGSEDYDDSSGKHRRQDSKTRSGLLLTALIAGVCLGVMFAERLYIHFQEAEQGGGMVPAGAGSGKVSRKLGQVRAVFGWKAGRQGVPKSYAKLARCTSHQTGIAAAEQTAQHVAWQTQDVAHDCRSTTSRGQSSRRSCSASRRTRRS